MATPVAPGDRVGAMTHPLARLRPRADPPGPQRQPSPVRGRPRPWAWLAALTLTFWLGACSLEPDASDLDHLSRAKAYAAQGDRKASVIELKNALQKNPDNLDARRLLGEVYLEDGQGGAAEKELLRARRLGMDRDALLPLLGRALILQGQYARALAEIELPRQAPAGLAARVRVVHGDARLGQGELDPACELYDQARRLDPAYPEGFLGLARCALRRGDPDRAYAWLQGAVKAAPDHAPTWVLLGETEAARGRTVESEAAYATALGLDPQLIAARTGRASARLKAGRLDAAAADVAALRTQAPNLPAGRYLQALIESRQAKPGRALETLAPILTPNNFYLPAVFLAGVLQERLGRHDDARQLLERYVAAAPGVLPARTALAGTYLRLNRPDRALDTLGPVLGETQDDPTVLALTGDALLALGDAARAVSYYERAVRADPKSFALRANLAGSRLAAGEVGEAVADLEVAATLDPTGRRADTLRVLTLLRGGRHAEALAAARALERKLPGSPVPFNLAGAVQAADRDWEGAARSFERALALAPDNLPAVLNLAQLDLRAGRTAAARARLERSLRTAPDSVPLRLALAETYRAAGDSAGFVAQIGRTMRVAPTALEPRLRLARHYLEVGNPQGALAVASEAGRLRPNHAGVLDVLGRAQAANGEYGNAAASYRQLISLRPKSVEAYFALATMQARTGDTRAARDSLERVLRLEPLHAEAAVALAMLLTRTGETAKARAIATKLQEKLPKSPAGFALEGDLRLAAGEAREAAAAYERAFEVAPSGPLAVSLYKAQRRAGEPEAAYARLSKWLTAHPDDAGTRLFQAAVLDADGRRAEAIEAYRKLPDNPVALNQLALALARDGQPGALAAAEKAHRLAPDSPAVADTLGWLLVQDGQVRRGFKLLRGASQALPADPEIRYHYAVALARSGKRDLARRELERALAAKTPFPQRAQARAFLSRLDD